MVVSLMFYLTRDMSSILTLFIPMDFPIVWDCPFCILRGHKSKYHSMGLSILVTGQNF